MNNTLAKLQIIMQGNAKGLRIQRASIEEWRVLLPNGGMYHAKNQADLLSYIAAY